MTNFKHPEQSAFNTGAARRAVHPLRSGKYKLVEARRKLLKWAQDVQSIHNYRRGLVSHPVLACCMLHESSNWLAQCPANIADLIGYSILPGITALNVDGVAPQVIATLIKSATAQSTDIVDATEITWDVPGWPQHYGDKLPAQPTAAVQACLATALGLVGQALEQVEACKSISPPPVGALLHK